MRGSGVNECVNQWGYCISIGRSIDNRDGIVRVGTEQDREYGMRVEGSGCNGDGRE